MSDYDELDNKYQRLREAFEALAADLEIPTFLGDDECDKAYFYAARQIRKVLANNV